MPDIGKVIKGLEVCTNRGMKCNTENCPYWDNDDCLDGLQEDALALLKEQEAVEPLPPESEIGTLWRCGLCGREIGFKYHFCQWCGQAVKWDD